LRTALLAAIAHDLTTPVTVIRSIADLLATESFADPEEPRFLAERVRIKADELAGLVEQLRDFSRLERGRITIERERLDLRALAVSLAADLAALHDDVVVEVQMDDDVVVEADRLAVTRILTNLLTNAISFSPSGGRVRVLARHRAGSVQVGVADEGPGVDPAFRDRIFEEFFQGSTAERRTSGGLGLGLSIVRQYATLHSGAVWVDSEPGAGATFWFELPASREG
jgi:signal transduction histidine kinase